MKGYNPMRQMGMSLFPEWVVGLGTYLASITALESSKIESKTFKYSYLTCMKGFVNLHQKLRGGWPDQRWGGGGQVPTIKPAGILGCS